MCTFLNSQQGSHKQKCDKSVDRSTILKNKKIVGTDLKEDWKYVEITYLT